MASQVFLKPSDLGHEVETSRMSDREVAASRTSIERPQRKALSRDL